MGKSLVAAPLFLAKAENLKHTRTNPVKGAGDITFLATTGRATTLACRLDDEALENTLMETHAHFNISGINIIWLVVVSVGETILDFNLGIFM